MQHYTNIQWPNPASIALHLTLQQPDQTFDHSVGRRGRHTYIYIYRMRRLYVQKRGSGVSTTVCPVFCTKQKKACIFIPTLLYYCKRSVGHTLPLSHIKTISLAQNWRYHSRREHNNRLLFTLVYKWSIIFYRPKGYHKNTNATAVEGDRSRAQQCQTVARLLTY